MNIIGRWITSRPYEISIHHRIEKKIESFCMRLLKKKKKSRTFDNKSSEEVEIIMSWQIARIK